MITLVSLQKILDLYLDRVGGSRSSWGVDREASPEDNSGLAEGHHLVNID